MRQNRCAPKNITGGYVLFVMLLCLFIAALWSPAGKGLTFWLSFVIFFCIFVTFHCGILGQMWYLNVLIPDLCHLSHWTINHSEDKTEHKYTEK